MTLSRTVRWVDGVPAGLPEENAAGGGEHL